MSYNKDHRAAIKYFDLPRGWVLHHKDIDMKVNDPVRYNEWRIEDLIPMKKEDHISYHQTVRNISTRDDVKAKISAANKGNHNIGGWNRGLTYRLGNHHHKAQPVRCLNDGKEFEIIQDAVKYYGFTGKSAGAKIGAVCRGEKPQYLGYRFEYIEY